MKISVQKVPLSEINALRNLFLEGVNFQLRYEACHSKNWADEYLIQLEGEAIGYGSIKGLNDLMKRDTIFEFYLSDEYKQYRQPAFSELLNVSQASWIETQSNDLSLFPLLAEFCYRIESDTLLFQDKHDTKLEKPTLHFRPRRETDGGFGQDKGAYVLLQGDVVVATGGFFLHYNAPFAEVYMEVNPSYRRQGFGTYILQKIKDLCYEQGKKTTARCLISNEASRATLRKAGFRVCAYQLKGSIR